MNDDPRRHAAHLDALLDRAGSPVLSGGGAAGADPLVRVLTALTAPARPGELAGLAAAQAVFASSEGAGATVAPIGGPRVRTGRFVVRGLAVAAGLSAVGGIAYAGVAGHLPGGHDAGPRHVPAATSSDDGHGPGRASRSVDPVSPSIPPATSPTAPPATSPRTPPSSGTHAPGHRPTHRSTPADPPSRTSRPAPRPGVVPRPALRGVCRAYFAHGDHARGNGRGRAYNVLIRLAGGPAEVRRYCITVVHVDPPRTHRSHPSHGPSAHPTTARTEPGRGQGHPSPAPSSSRTGSS